ncbi:hypothetical protein [Streptomyces sp. NBC_01465]|uniref:hypothetical protein n=1 Tax=Streptomyces sp. NBC_01465 TaxID=2903878 RepID=UPI002E35E48C|nr:hypothetical protein [Streptomyces sp. NBC_01465]
MARTRCITDRALSWGSTLALALAAFTGIPASPAAADNAPLVDEAFSGVTVPEGKWFSNSKGGAKDRTGFACLTAASGTQGPLKACKGGKAIDKAGRGALRLTGSARGQSGFAVLNTAFPSHQGVSATFDAYQYGTTTGGTFKTGKKKGKPVGGGADGITVFLLDGSVSPKDSGNVGGGNGYVGIEGGYIGVTLDQWGNMADPGKSKAPGGPGRTPNSVTVRGATSAKNPWIHTKKMPRPIAVDGAKSRSKAIRKVKADLTPSGRFSIAVDFGDGKGYVTLVNKVDIDSVKGQPALPETLKIGFAAGTGDNTAVHEIANVDVDTLGPDLSIKRTTDGDIVAGGTGTIHYTVSNDPNAGPSDQPVTFHRHFGDGLTPTDASGDGWDCTYTDTDVDCTRPGTGGDSLPPGASYPPVDIPLQAAPDASGDVPTEGDVSTPDDKNPKNDEDKTPIPVKPQTGLSIAVAGNPDTYTAGADVAFAIAVGNEGPSDAKGAPLSVQLPKYLAGAVCRTADGKTCGTADPDGKLNFPVDVPAGGEKDFTVTGTTPGDSTDPITARAHVSPPPDTVDELCDGGCSDSATLEGQAVTSLAVTETHRPDPYSAGQQLTMTITVTNGGPSDAIGARIKDQLPEQLRKFSWTCKAAAGSACGSAKGQGDIDETVDVAANSQVVYTVTGVVAPAIITDSVGVTPPDSVTDTSCAEGCSAGDQVAVH